MSENQNIEWKESWRDEYLEWICGFANAQGGKIYIGIDDSGNVSGLKNSKALLENIPNKIVNYLGIIADVNLYGDNDENSYIEIDVNPSAFPVSYRGKYHYRCGSTKQILQGNSLTQFLLKKLGTTWDNLSVDSPKFNDLRHDAFDIFKEQAVINRRMGPSDVDIDNELLLKDLNLIDEAGNLKRAAVLLFHHNPEAIIPGSFIKIAYFTSDSEIEYQDEIHGSLMHQAISVIDLIFTKYLKATISYEGVTRIEKYPYPREALREAVFNAIAHKNYGSLIPIQISVYDNKIYIANECIFPDGWTVKNLFEKHNSRPQNPLIANAFYRAGFIESWGRGIKKITDACEKYNIPSPDYTISKSDIIIKFELDTAQKTAQKTTRKTTRKKLSENQKLILECISNNPNISRNDIAKEINGITESGVKYNLKALKDKGIIRRIGSAKNGYWEIVQQD